MPSATGEAVKAGSAREHSRAALHGVNIRGGHWGVPARTYKLNHAGSEIDEMRKIAYTVVASIMYCLTGSVVAAGMPVSWELNLGGSTNNTSVGNQWTKTNATGQTVKARAYYANQSSGNPTGTLGKSIVNQYSGGLAVCTTGETCSSAPEHALDNHLKQDYLLLEFDDIYAMSQFTIGWNAYQDVK